MRLSGREEWSKGTLAHNAGLSLSEGCEADASSRIEEVFLSPERGLDATVVFSFAAWEDSLAQTRTQSFLFLRRRQNHKQKLNCLVLADSDCISSVCNVQVIRQAMKNKKVQLKMIGFWWKLSFCENKSLCNNLFNNFFFQDVGLSQKLVQRKSDSFSLVQHGLWRTTTQEKAPGHWSRRLYLGLIRGLYLGLTTWGRKWQSPRKFSANLSWSDPWEAGGMFLPKLPLWSPSWGHRDLHPAQPDQTSQSF